MRFIKEIYRNNKAFFLAYFVLLVISLFFALYYGKVDTQIFVNKHNSPWADVFFKYFTYLGSGYFLVAVISLAAIVRGRVAGALLFSGLISTFLAQLLKRLVGAFRPVKYFELFVPDYNLHLVDGVKMHYLHSFPSGHAATAFAVFLFLAFLTRKNWLKLVYLFLAVLVAYSRVYLSQHFLIDVIAGSIVGIISTVAGLIWYLATEEIKRQENSA